MTLRLRTPAEEAADAAAVVRAMTRDLRESREFFVTEQHQELVSSVREMATVLDAIATVDDAAARSKRDGDRTQRRADSRRN